jgi:hypothetical protein
MEDEIVFIGQRDITVAAIQEAELRDDFGGTEIEPSPQKIQFGNVQI